jgi:Xaa-Pro aminopeptidase
MAVTENVTPAVRPDRLPPMDVAGRLDRLRTGFDGAGIDALVVSSLTNIRYLTGFTGSSAVLLVTSTSALFVTDGRYTTQSAQQLGDSSVEAEIEISTESPELAASKGAKGIARLGLEADTVTWASQRRWAGELYDGSLVATSGLVEDLRLVKDAGEAVRVRSACAIADEAFGTIRHRLAEGPTEREFALELEAEMMRLGADDLSFDTIVAAGPNGAKPHHSPSDRRVSEGDLVVVDFGALLDGYHSDMTRTVAVGEVGPERTRMLDVVLEAQARGVDLVAAGEEAAEVDAACREVIAENGWADAFIHGTGHGVGLDIHEEPRVSGRSTATLTAGHIVTVEPGVYLPDLGGVRIEDTVLVTDDGCDRLTLAPKEPQLT